ncbi:MAG: hypothetical protein Q9163_005974 [Psora crenata]
MVSNPSLASVKTSQIKAENDQVDRGVIFGSSIDNNRIRYIERIAKYLPKDQQTSRKISAMNKPLGHHVGQGHPDGYPIDANQIENNPFLDWRTALGFLKRHYKPQATVAMDGVGGIIRKVGHRVTRYGLKQTITPPKKPAEWSEAVLTTYIQGLADFRPPRPILFEVLSTAQKDKNLASIVDVADNMEQILNDPHLRQYLSTRACNIALQFFYDRSMMTRARRLYSRMEYLCLDLSGSTWNIMLRACAGQKDLHNFTYLLQEMILRGFKPDEKTWVTFLMVLNSLEAKKAVVNIMRKAGIMENHWTGRDVANQMVRHEFADHSTRGADGAPFFTKMGQLYGPDWLSTSVGNTLISAVMETSQGQATRAIVQALSLLYESKQYAFEANQVTMHIFLRQCTRVQRQDLIIEILSIFETQWGLKPDQMAHQLLFELAWRRKRLNMLRVIWISACLNGFVTFRMQNRIMQSLLKNTEAVQTLDRPFSFSGLVGRFLVGVERRYQWARGYDLEWKERVPATYILALKSNLATAGQGRLTDGLVVQSRLASDVDNHWASADFWSDPQQQTALLKTSLKINIASPKLEPIGKVHHGKLRRRIQRRRKGALTRHLDLRHGAGNVP